jgi:hypothetical protein
VLSFKLIIEQMFEHWRQLTYFDATESVFPSDELLDDLGLYDMAPRKHVSKALQGLLLDFNQFLVESGHYDWFYANGYERVMSNNETLLFY